MWDQVSVYVCACVFGLEIEISAPFSCVSEYSSTTSKAMFSPSEDFTRKAYHLRKHIQNLQGCLHYVYVQPSIILSDFYSRTIQTASRRSTIVQNPSSLQFILHASVNTRTHPHTPAYNRIQPHTTASKGGGVDLIAACDIRYCTSDAWFAIKVKSTSTKTEHEY